MSIIKTKDSEQRKIQNSYSVPNQTAMNALTGIPASQSQQGPNAVVTAANASASTNHQKVQSAGTNVVGVHYKIGRKIGEGSFGIIYEGISR